MKTTGLPLNTKQRPRKLKGLLGTQLKYRGHGSMTSHLKNITQAQSSQQTMSF